jgi:hypothetical protein
MADFLAVALIGAGSSYARGPNKEDTILRCKHFVESDWKTLYHLDGQPCKINVIDVEGYDKVWWDARGFHTSEDTLTDAKLDVEVREVILSVPEQRKKKAKR